MCVADVILEIKLNKINDDYVIFEEYFVEFFLKKYVHFDVTPVSSPYDHALHLKKNKGSEYVQVIGSLNYLMNGSGPDIAYAVNKLSKYTHNPNNDRWTALYRV